MTERIAPWRCEYEIVQAPPTIDQLSEFDGQPLWQRNGASLMTLGRALDQLSTNVGESATHVQAPANQIYVPDSKRGDFAPAQPGIGEGSDKCGVWPGCSGQLLHLVVSEEPPLSAGDQTGELHAPNWVTGKPSSPHRVVTYKRDDADGLSSPRGRQTNADHPVDPRCNIVGPDPPEGNTSPSRQDLVT
jgi:hypothetical protein